MTHSKSRQGCVTSSVTSHEEPNLRSTSLEWVVNQITPLTPSFAEKSVTLQKKTPRRLSCLGLRLIVITSVNASQIKHLDDKSYFQ